MALRDGAVEDQPPHPPLVRRRFRRPRDPGLAAQLGIETSHARTHPGIGETDLHRVVPQVGAHSRRRRDQARERAEALDLALGVHEESVVVRDDPAVGRYYLEHGRVVTLPERQAEGIGVLVAALQRKGDLERMAHADHETEIRLEVEPVARREACARILETPVVVLAQRHQRRRRGLGNVGHTRVVDRLGRQGGRVVPGAARRFEEFVIARDDRLVLPEAFGVVLRRIDEFLRAAPDQVETGIVQRPRDHRRTRSMHTGDSDRRVLRFERHS